MSVVSRFMQGLAVVGAAGSLYAALPPAPPGVQVTHEYGQEFVTIGDVGNRATQPEELLDDPRWQIGAVPYEYRIARTEVTVGQWLEFVRAYDQFNDPPRVDAAFHGHGIAWDFAGQRWYATMPLNFPTTVSWDYAARYCNWLTNEKAMTGPAFVSGAYDTTTFTYNPNGTSNYQESHSPDAKFWIPSNDEWTKATYWDPAKNSGDGGYWYYPGTSDELLISGPPGIGQTNGGYGEALTAVSSYPDTQTPWGLLDASGGVREWCESIWAPNTRSRFVRSSKAGDPSHDLWDAVDNPRSSFVSNRLIGLRIAAIPNVATCVIPVLVYCHTQRRRRCAS